MHLTYKLPKKISGKRAVKIVAALKAKRRALRSMKMAATALCPVTTVDKLIDLNRPVLDTIDPPQIPNRMSPDRLRLSLLDGQLREKNKVLFKTEAKRLKMTAPRRFTDSVKTEISGLYEVKLVSTGKTRGGYAFQRVRRFNLRV